jgi:hypothetical protein
MSTSIATAAAAMKERLVPVVRRELANHPVRTTVDGMAAIGRTSHDLRGIRFDENDGGNTNGDTDAAAAAAAAQAATDAAAAAASTGVAAAPAWDGKIESLHPDAQKIITDLRKENGDRRVALTAAETRTQAILTAAGIKTDEADPVEVAKTATAAASKATRELAVFKAASAAGADPTKLLDRTSFTASIAGIDPSDGPAIKAAIDAAVAADASLKAARAAGASSIDNPGGTGEVGQITEAQLAQMTPEQISDAFDKGLLKNLL